MKVIPTAKAYGVNLEQVSSGYVMLTAKGIKSAEATTYLNSMLNEMGKTGTKSSDVIKELSGKSFQDLISEGKSVGDILAMMQEHGDKNNLSLADMFGSGEAAKAGMILAGNAGKDFNDVLEGMNNTAGATDAAFEKVSDTTGEKLKRSLNEMKNNAINLGDAIAPVIANISEMIGRIAKKLSELTPAQLNLIVIVGMVIAAISPVAKVIQGVSMAVNGVTTALTFLSQHPVIMVIALVVAAIVGLVLVIKHLWETNEGFRTAIINIWEGIKNAITITINAISTVITTVFTGVATFCTFIWGTIKATIETVVLAIKFVVETVFTLLVTIIKVPLEIIKAIITTIWNYIGGYITTIVNSIKSVIETVWNAIATVTTTVFNAIKNVIMSIWNIIAGFITTIVNSIKSVIETVWNAIKSITSTVWNAIKSVIIEPLESAKNKVAAIVFIIKSTVEGVWDGIKSNTQEKWNAIKESIMGPINSAKDGVRSALDAIHGFFEKLKLKFPKIEMPPLPHFSLNGSFSLNPPSVPKLNVDWYDKGGIFNTPQVIGVGEKRPEFVGALDDLRYLIRDELNKKQNNGVTQNLTINSPTALSPSEIARQNKRALQELALGF